MRAALSLRLMDSSSKPASLSFFHMASSLKGVFRSLDEPEIGVRKSWDETEFGVVNFTVAGVFGITANLSERELGLAID